MGGAAAATLLVVMDAVVVDVVVVDVVAVVVDVVVVVLFVVLVVVVPDVAVLEGAVRDGALLAATAVGTVGAPAPVVVLPQAGARSSTTPSVTQISQCGPPRGVRPPIIRRDRRGAVGSSQVGLTVRRG